MSELITRFSEIGFIDSISVFSSSEVSILWQAVQKELNHPPLDWDKGYAASSRLFFEIANHGNIVTILEQLLGKDIILWGASVVSKPAGAVHPWHNDVESCSVGRGNTVSVWIGLNNTNDQTALQFISHSHLQKKSIQQLRKEICKTRLEVTSVDALEWARKDMPHCELVCGLAQDGEAIFFHGNIWHYSHNTSTSPRHALLLQYATPDAEIFIPDPNSYDWPFQKINQPRPPCILIKGDDHHASNRLVLPPESDRIKSRISIKENRIHPIQVPLPIPVDVLWKPFYIFNGRTAHLDHITCHISALRPGHQPHPPHQHREEELLIVLAGTVEVILPELDSPEKLYRKVLQPGQFVYYPAFFLHTIEAIGESPANYLMIKWYNDVPVPHEIITFGNYSIYDQEDATPVQIRYRHLFEGATAGLEKLHCHSTVIPPGSSYDPHRDAYDVAILLLEGEVETAGQRIPAPGFIFYPAGQLHGMANSSDVNARYLVFEFHRSRSVRIPPHSVYEEPNSQEEKTESLIPVLQAQLERRNQELFEIRESISWRFGRWCTRKATSFVTWNSGLRKMAEKWSGKKL